MPLRGPREADTKHKSSALHEAIVSPRWCTRRPSYYVSPRDREPHENATYRRDSGRRNRKEVVPEGMRVLERCRAASAALQFDHFDFANCDYFAKHGAMMPDDWKDRIGQHDAIFYGAVGWPATVPDHVSLWAR